MEKVIYALWRKPNEDRSTFAKRLVNETGPELLKLGARGLQLNVIDDVVAPAKGLVRVATNPQMDAVVHLRVDSAIATFRKPYDQALENASARIAGYLVSESKPVVNTTQRAPEGQRTPGFSQCVFITRPQGLTSEAWIDVWHNVTTPVAIECQGNRPLTHAAPAYDALVEECLPSEAMTDPTVFFDRGRNPEKAVDNRRRMMEAAAFVTDVNQIDVIATSQYIFRWPRL
jgi:hypothetical protein